MRLTAPDSEPVTAVELHLCDFRAMHCVHAWHYQGRRQSTLNIVSVRDSVMETERLSRVSDFRGWPGKQVHCRGRNQEGGI